MDQRWAIGEIQKLIERGRELEPTESSPEFKQWRTTTMSRLEHLIPKSIVISQFSGLRFAPSGGEYLMARRRGPRVDAVARFDEAMGHAIALLNAAIEEIEFASRRDSESGDMSSSVNIDSGAIAQMMGEIQREFAKHGPVRIPVEVDERGLGAQPAPAGGTVNIHVVGDHAQIAYGIGNQQTQNTQQIAPGFEAIATAVTEILKGFSTVPLGHLGLDEQHRKDVEQSGHDVLDEVTQSAPDKGKVRQTVAALKGFLVPVLLAAQTGAAQEVEEWVRTAIEQLGSALS